MSTIKFREKKLSEVCDTDTLVVNVWPLTFFASIEINQIIRHPSKANKLRDVNTIRSGAENITVQNWKINNVAIKIIAFAIDFNGR